jgi:hypothetical protein
VKANDTAKALELLNEEVPPTFVDEGNGWTVIECVYYFDVQLSLFTGY